MKRRLFLALCAAAPIVHAGPLVRGTRSGGGGGVGPVPASVVITSVVGAVGQATLDWQAPTTKFDGSALPGGDISHYLMRRYNTSGVLQEGPSNVGNVLTYASTDPAGTWEYTVACVSTYGEGEESARLQAVVT